MTTMDLKIVTSIVLFYSIVTHALQLKTPMTTSGNRHPFALCYEVRKSPEASWDSWNEKPLRNLHLHNTSYPYDQNHVFETRLVKVCCYCFLLIINYFLVTKYILIHVCLFYTSSSGFT